MEKGIGLVLEVIAWGVVVIFVWDMLMHPIVKDPKVTGEDGEQDDE